MQAAPPETRAFLAAHHPFDQLPDETLAQLAERIESRRFQAGETLLEPGRRNVHLHVVRRGAVEVRDRDGQLLARLAEGDLFGYRALLRGGTVENRVTALEDGTLLLLASTELDRLCDAFPQVAYFFGAPGGRRLREVLERSRHDDPATLNLMTTPVRQMLSRPPVSVPPTASIAAVARGMSEHRVSSMLVCEGQRLVGIVTDRDLRNRVLAAGLSPERAVAEVMTREPLTIGAADFAFEAMLAMARNNIHHLPVLEGGRVAGMLTATDLGERQATSAVYLVGSIYRQESVEEMRESTGRIPRLLVNLAEAGASAQSIGHVITALGDAVTVRLLQLAERRLGPPPVRYAWVAAGSQARNEQVAHSDQDNCLVLADDYDARRHSEYFRALTSEVCSGLDRAGYAYCPGEMMAMNERWRQPLAAWRRDFDRWIDQPEPKALMLTCVFFDLRCLHGDPELLRALRAHVLEKTRGNSIFLAYMAVNALSHQPPLGFFRNFVLIRGGEHDRTLDLKHSGIIPIVDLARVFALAAGSDAVNTQERLTAALAGGGVSEPGAQDLRDALEFIGQVRVRHQARRIRAGQPADNFMGPDDLSPLERNHLKDAFAVVRTMQGALASRFQTHRFG